MPTNDLPIRSAQPEKKRRLYIEILNVVASGQETLSPSAAKAIMEMMLEMRHVPPGYAQHRRDAMTDRWEYAMHDRALEREQILDLIEQGIMDRMDIDTNASHWALGAFDALINAGFKIVRGDQP